MGSELNTGNRNLEFSHLYFFLSVSESMINTEVFQDVSVS